MKTRQIVGIGETVLDVIFKNDQPQAAVPGGSAFNAMISLGRSIGVTRPEIPIRMITETGDDHIGDIVVNFMRENNVSTDCVTRNRGTQTHVSMAFLNERNDAHYEFFKDHANAKLNAETVGCVDFEADDVLVTSSYFSINPVLRDCTLPLFRKAHAAGAIIYYDVNFRSSHAAEIPVLMPNILENFRLADIVRASTEDCRILFGTEDLQEVYSKFLSEHCRLFICTDGGRPLTLITPQFTAKYPVEKIDTVSTIGAGDNFNAGFVCALIENEVAKSQLQTSGKALWDKLIASGQAFSAEVCQTIFNYIEKVRHDLS